MENWLMNDKDLGKIVNNDDRKKVTEAFFAFAQFSPEFPGGRISFKELKKVLQDIGQSASDEEINKIIHENSLNHKGYIDATDFLQMIAYQKKQYQ
jgi:Ca2+-binding EF-hand superfamily protein